ncbi:M15 family metallopeptidase [Idiomarina sp. UBA3162]|uniref:M15 family metallopeptidase n=1 Tax=Idiomarina sp. UBA3162 TaxID=1946641 RepID=UPI000C90887B|nr:M15 family metallopeptidase [Idiomarina sp. UBA3162]MAD54963.1 D-alanyl-D-alanine carboxypeptidase [Idiomarinaceae bacterium]
MMTVMQRLGLMEDHLQRMPEGHLLHPLAAQAFLNMQAAAKHDGISLAIASAFRSFDRQRMIWNRKWRGERVINDIDGQPLKTDKLNDEEKLHAILHWSALPGASRHHWGTDIDIWDPSGFTEDSPLQLIPAEYEDINAPCYQLWSWLKAHAHDYGFFFPYRVYQGGVAREPWHLSYQPLAQQLQDLLTVGELAEAIERADIEGKTIILTHLETIKRRYFDTICESSQGG